MVREKNLLNDLHKRVGNNGVITAWIDGNKWSMGDSNEFMQKIAKELNGKGCKLENFEKIFKAYRTQTSSDNLQTSSSPSSGNLQTSSPLLEMGIKSVINAGDSLLANGVIGKVVGEDGKKVMVQEVEKVAENLFSRNQLEGKYDLSTDLFDAFLRDIRSILRGKVFIVFLDNYDRTAYFLDEWLQKILRIYRQEKLNKLMIFITSQRKLEGHNLSLFTNEIKFINLISCANIDLDKSGKLSDEVNDFLESIDPSKQSIVLKLAIPRWFNQDIVTQLVEGRDVEEDFDWLIKKQRHFVEEDDSNHNWIYKKSERDNLQCFMHHASPQHWTAIHKKIADYYEALLDDLQIDPDKKNDEECQKYKLEVLYHRLCQKPQAYLPEALSGFLVALQQNILSWMSTFRQAAEDSESALIKQWSELLDSIYQYSGCDSLSDEIR